MGGWLLIWILFIAGFFPLGLGIYLLVNKKLRADREQRRAAAFVYREASGRRMERLRFLLAEGP